MAGEEVYPFIYSTLGTVISLAGLMFVIIRWRESKADIIARELKELEKERAEQLEKAEAEKARVLREYADKLHSEVTTSLENMDNKLTVTQEDLRKRADLTNGNVSFIRADIADLQEDMLDLWDSTANGKQSQSFDRTKKMKALERRKRRRKIEADRIAQSER